MPFARNEGMEQTLPSDASTIPGPFRRAIARMGSRLSPPPHDEPNVRFALLFGSAPRGEPGPQSDLDIAVSLRTGSDAVRWKHEFLDRLIRETGMERVVTARADWPRVRIRPCPDRVERNFQVAIEAMTAVANHVISERRLRLPQDTGDRFSVLAEAGLISTASAARLRSWAGFRNVLVHEDAGNRSRDRPSRAHRGARRATRAWRRDRPPHQRPLAPARRADPGRVFRSGRGLAASYERAAGEHSPAAP